MSKTKIMYKQPMFLRIKAAITIVILAALYCEPGFAGTVDGMYKGTMDLNSADVARTEYSMAGPAPKETLNGAPLRETLRGPMLPGNFTIGTAITC